MAASVLWKKPFLQHRITLKLHKSCQLDVISKKKNLVTDNMSMPIANGISNYSAPTAGLIVIGDEILKGQTQDTNTKFIAQRLHSYGVKVCKVSVIPDDIDTVATEVAQFSHAYKHVITSGGIGPTHDDITLQGVAKAFNEKLMPHPQLVELIHKYFKTDDMNSAAMKMAFIPESATLLYGKDEVKGYTSPFPIVSVHNVTIFPGIPRQLEKAFSMLGPKLFRNPDNMPFFVKQLYITTDEVSIAPFLSKTLSLFPSVTIGSYPKIFHNYYNAKVVMESSIQTHVEMAVDNFRSMLSTGCEINYIDDPITDAWKYIEQLPTVCPELQGALRESIQVIYQCLQQYNPEEICVCFNGGKDCLVVLHLFYAILTNKFTDKQVHALYITDDNVFPQEAQFVQQSIKRYNLHCTTLPGPMKQSVTELLHKCPNVKAVIMGNRVGDPYADKLIFFSPTDSDWPSVMRVNPILNWKYDLVWKFIRGLFLPYCTLYDRGYTSLGNQDNTLPNPLLKTTDSLDQVTFLPAYKLTQLDQERIGRIFGKQ